MTIIKEPNLPATHAMIWMHGLGASNQDMIGVVEALQIKDVPIRHVFLQAPNKAVTINQGMVMPAWYDIVGNSLTDREDHEGILSSEKIIIDAIKQQEKQGISNYAYCYYFYCFHTGLSLPKKSPVLDVAQFFKI